MDILRIVMAIFWLILCIAIVGGDRVGRFLAVMMALSLALLNIALVLK